MLATYTIKDSVVTVTFTDYIEQAEDVSALFARLELAMAYNQDVLTSEVQETTWSIQNYTDGTSYDLTIQLPAFETEDDQNEPEDPKLEDTEEEKIATWVNETGTGTQEETIESKLAAVFNKTNT